jgi:hypothetical protein
MASRSMALSIFVGLSTIRTTYIPAHSKNGTDVNQRLMIDAFCNLPGLENDGRGRADVYNFTVWNKMADVGAKSLSRGKDFSCVCVPQLYDGRVFQPSTVQGQPGTMVTKADGTPLTTKKVGFKMIPGWILFGAESQKHILEEIQAGQRPIGWNLPGTADYQEWQAELEKRRNMPFNPNSPVYGYATVETPRGAGIGPFQGKGNAIDGNNTNELMTGLMTMLRAQAGGAAVENANAGVDIQALLNAAKQTGTPVDQPKPSRFFQVGV